MSLLLVAVLDLPARTNTLYGSAIDKSGRAYQYKRPSAKNYIKWGVKVLGAYKTPAPWKVWQDGQAIADARASRSALQVTSWFYFKTAGSDIDGPLKTLLDMLQSYLGINDNRVYSAPLMKFVDPLFERVEFRVESISKPDYLSLWDVTFAQETDERSNAWDLTVPDLPVAG